jgi:hypothetical protein
MNWYRRWGIIGALALAQLGAIVAYQVFLAGHGSPARAAAQEKVSPPPAKKDEPATLTPVPVVDAKDAGLILPPLSEPKQLPEMKPAVVELPPVLPAPPPIPGDQLVPAAAQEKTANPPGTTTLPSVLPSPRLDVPPAPLAPVGPVAPVAPQGKHTDQKEPAAPTLPQAPLPKPELSVPAPVQPPVQQSHEQFMMLQQEKMLKDALEKQKAMEAQRANADGAKPLAPSTAPLPPLDQLVQPAKHQTVVGPCPWTLRIEIINAKTNDNGKTLLTASVGKEVQFRIMCDKLDLQSPRGIIDATGSVTLTSEGLDGTCDRLQITWVEDVVVLEGKANLKCQRDGQEVELKAERLSLRLSASGVVPARTTASSRATHEPPVPPRARSSTMVPVVDQPSGVSEVVTPIVPKVQD